MTESNNPSTEPNTQRSAEESVKTFHDTVSQFLHAADVKTAFGAPIQESGVTVIPCAEVISVMAGGLGSGYGRSNAADPSKPESNDSGGGGGGGGGGRVLSRPVAVIVITPGGVEVKQVVDGTKIALAAITAWGFMLTMVMRMIMRRHRPGKPG